MAAADVQKGLQSLRLSEPHIMHKLPPGTIGRVKNVDSNCYSTRLQKNLVFFLYSVDIIAEFDREGGESKRKQITKRTKDDFLEQERKRIATLVFTSICERNTLPGACAYDRASLLISLQQLKKADEGDWHFVVQKDASAPFKENAIKEANRLHVTIKKAADTFQVTSSDLQQLNPEGLQALMAVVSIGTSQNIFREFDRFIVYKTGVFLMDPSFLQLGNIKSGSDEKYIGQGFAKGVDVVGAEGGERTIALTVDAKKTAFHYDYQSVADKMMAMGIECYIHLCNRHLKRLSALVYYKGVYKQGDQWRAVQIDGFGGPVKDAVVDINGKKMKLVVFVKEKYNTVLMDLSLPIVITKYHGIFSPECLLIAPSQRVRVEQMQKIVQEAIIRASASKPSDRKHEISMLRGTINPPQELGMVIEQQPMKVAARILDSPAIGTGSVDVKPRNGTWQVNKFVRGAECKNWTLAYIRMKSDRVDLKTAANAIVRKAADLGMALGFPKLVEAPANGREDELTAELVKRAKMDGSAFIMLITNSKIFNHDALKKAELDYGIVTQQLKSETAGVLHTRGATLANLLKKTNEKLGGVNLTVSSKHLPAWLLARSTLVCGMTIDHPRPQTKDEVERKCQPDRPAIISWGMNAVKGGDGLQEATHFSGGYVYANPREGLRIPSQETTKNAVITRIVDSFRSCRGVLPAHVLLIRRMVLSEVAEWRAVFASLGVAPKLVVVTANLNHSSRVFDTRIDVKARPMEQNLEAGLTVDSGITSPELNEFLQQAHVPRQGTARPTKYNLLYADEGVEITMDEIEMAVFTLCHTHGVCDMTTALPTPLKVSEEFAKRALNLFHYNTKKDWTIDQLNKERAVQQNTPLDNIRFNA